MPDFTDVKCGRRNQYELQILSFYGRERIYYGEIMIYVNGWADVRLSKEWRYEPIMINALSVFSPSPPGSSRRWSSSLQPSTLRSSTFNQHTFMWLNISFSLIFSYQMSDLAIFCFIFHVICLCGGYCRWWIPMIQCFRVHRAKQSPLSCDWAISLCQTSPIHPTWARQWTRGREMTKIKYARWK